MFVVAAAASTVGAAGLSFEPLVQSSPAGSVQAADRVGPVDLDPAVDVGPAGPVVVQAAGHDVIAGVEDLVCPELAEGRLGIAEVELKGVERFEEAEVYHSEGARAGTGVCHSGLHACLGAAPNRVAEYAGQAGRCSPEPVELGGLAPAE